MKKIPILLLAGFVISFQATQANIFTGGISVDIVQAGEAVQHYSSVLPQFKDLLSEFNAALQSTDATIKDDILNNLTDIDTFAQRMAQASVVFKDDNQVTAQTSLTTIRNTVESFNSIKSIITNIQNIIDTFHYIVMAINHILVDQPSWASVAQQAGALMEQINQPSSLQSFANMGTHVKHIGTVLPQYSAQFYAETMSIYKVAIPALTQVIDLIDQLLKKAQEPLEKLQNMHLEQI